MRKQKVMILGNSITWHHPKADIFWLDDWGMAASSRDKDFSHLLLKKFAEDNGGKAPEELIENIAEFEREYETYDVETKFQRFADFKPDYLIIAIGENIPAIDSPELQEKFRLVFRRVLKTLTSKSKPKIFVRNCFWANPSKDKVLKEVCEEFGGTLVNISELCKDESNFGRSERKFQHEGVAAHPGDKGMAAIADAIWKAIKK